MVAIIIIEIAILAGVVYLKFFKKHKSWKDARNVYGHYRVLYVYFPTQMQSNIDRFLMLLSASNRSLYNISALILFHWQLKHEPIKILLRLLFLSKQVIFMMM